jgi:erythronate-4-phosphate dehydrogenase
MIIAVDRAIPFWEEVFPQLGQVRPFSGRDVTNRDIRDADALIVRSITLVDRDLLDSSSVRFVATATIGTDHLDQEYLASRGICVASAAGCNANAVAEYVITALLVVAEKKGWDLTRMSLGIVGAGNIGSIVNLKARALGMTVVLNDPPLKDLTGDPQYLPFDEVLQADILTFHVPLTLEGPYPTWHMISQEALKRLSPHQFLINSSRGAVFKQDDVKHALQEGKIAGAVLDVWNDEPGIDYSLLDLVDIGTAHIAGYSLDGRIRATEMIFQQLCSFWGASHSWENSHLYPEPKPVTLNSTCRAAGVLLSAVLEAYDILQDDRKLRALEGLPESQAAWQFEQLRTEYKLRPEFRHFIIKLAPEHSALVETIFGLGFQVDTPVPFCGE